MATLSNYRTMLAVNRHRLDDELEIQADIMDRISQEVVARNTAFLAAKEQLAATEGRLTMSIKDQDAKATVAVIEAQVRADNGRTRDWRALQTAREDLESWQGLLESWRQRGFSIKTLADLYTANYFQTDSAGRERRDAPDDQARAAMRRASHGAHRIGDREATDRRGFTPASAPTANLGTTDRPPRTRLT